MKTNEQQGEQRARMSFIALDPYLESNIIKPTERLISGVDGRVEWGDGNAYPDYLMDLYDNVPTLQSIINGTSDFICGDDVQIKALRPGRKDGQMNMRGDTIASQVRNIAEDINTFGGFALQIVRGRDGAPSEIYYIDIRYLRTNKENTVFWYCEGWRRGARKAIVYPAFMPGLEWETLSDKEKERHASGILFVKLSNKHVYPVPRYASAVKACEIERGIDNYHLNALDNGFTPSQLVNFNNGVPDDDIREEIEQDMTEKFSGHQNAGRIMFSWNRSKENATTLSSIKVEDFGERYNALSKRTLQQIFTAFRANPNLFGIPTEGNGFANEQYEESFNLYNRTVVRPLQAVICDAYDKIYGEQGVLTITPFSLAVTNVNKVVR